MGPRSSIGLPRGSTTRPRYASPTGTEDLTSAVLRPALFNTGEVTWTIAPILPGIQVLCEGRGCRLPKQKQLIRHNRGRPSTRTIPSEAGTTRPTSARSPFAGFVRRCKLIQHITDIFGVMVQFEPRLVSPALSFVVAFRQRNQPKLTIQVERAGSTAASAEGGINTRTRYRGIFITVATNGFSVAKLESPSPRWNESGPDIAGLGGYRPSPRHTLNTGPPGTAGSTETSELRLTAVHGVGRLRPRRSAVPATALSHKLLANVTVLSRDDDFSMNSSARLPAS